MSWAALWQASSACCWASSSWGASCRGGSEETTRVLFVNGTGSMPPRWRRTSFPHKFGLRPTLGVGNFEKRECSFLQPYQEPLARPLRNRRRGPRAGAGREAGNSRNTPRAALATDETQQEKPVNVVDGGTAGTPRRCAVLCPRCVR